MRKDVTAVDCEHEQKTNTSGKVPQVRSASLQRHSNQPNLPQDYKREDLYGSD